MTSYTDSRELQALVPGGVFDRSEPGELWLDYAADLGDGFNSTYTVARLLSRPHLGIGDADHEYETERGSILVMGGDQVYPVPTRTNYENRLLGPYQAARPCEAAASSSLFAIPGSHDWYDGLVNFSNVFCRQRSIGGWRTCQTRSYFALRLPHRWWLWGVDMQFGDYLDEAQLAYFAEAAQDMRPGDRIIVCMAKEVESGRKSAEVCSDRNLGYLEREVVTPTGASVALYLKSGRHHYCRYRTRRARPSSSPRAAAAPSSIPPTTCPSGPVPRATRPRANSSWPPSTRLDPLRGGSGSGRGCSLPTTCRWRESWAGSRCCWRSCWAFTSTTGIDRSDSPTWPGRCGTAQPHSCSSSS